MQSLRKFDLSVGSILEDGAKIMFLVFSALVLIICVVYQLLSVTFPYSMDYGEAPLVDQAMRLASGQNIYRTDISTPPYTISNYPPVYVAVLAIGVKIFGVTSAFFFGRIISVLSAWAAVIMIILIIYTPTRDRFAALSAGVTFLAFPFVVYWSPLLRIDMLALALSLGGLCLLVREPLTLRRFSLASLLLVAAIYTRQSYALAAPLAGFIWLLTRDWRQALRLAGLVGGLTLILFFLFNGLTHGGFYFNIVTANVNEFKMANLKYHWDQLREIALIPLIFGGLSLFLSRRLNPLWTLAAPYLLGAALSAVTIGKIGSNVNYLLELCVALSLAVGVIVASSRVHLPVYSLRAVLLIMLVFAVGNMLHFTLQDQTGDLRERRAETRELSALKALVAKTQGPILADEYMGMISLQGRPLEIQPFEVTQLAWAGKWDQTPLLESIKNKEYSAIIIYDKPWANERWTQEMFDAINGSYTLSDIVAENKVYVPYQLKTTASLSACPGAVWQLPSDGALGVQWESGGLNFFGHGNMGEVPVYAVADGLLTRLPGWVNAVAIQHDDPLNPGATVWSVYGSMGAANGTDSFVAADFPIAVENIPVKAGQLLGYQGAWSGNPSWPMWMHALFILTRSMNQDALPTTFTPNLVLDPTPYLNLALQAENKNMQSLQCAQP